MTEYLYYKISKAFRIYVRSGFIELDKLDNASVSFIEPELLVGQIVLLYIDQCYEDMNKMCRVVVWLYVSFIVVDIELVDI